MNQNPLPAPQPPARNPTALEAEITELAAHLNAATDSLLALIREFDERHGWSGATPVAAAPGGITWTLRARPTLSSIMSATGPMAARPDSTTCCYCAVAITAWCTKVGTAWQCL